jgi:hypothetical protein
MRLLLVFAAIGAVVGAVLGLLAPALLGDDRLSLGEVAFLGAVSALLFAGASLPRLARETGARARR